MTVELASPPPTPAGEPVKATRADILFLDAVTKRWPKRPDPVLDAVGLNVPFGSTVHIGGRNGIGKTTLLRIAAGLIRPDEGTVSLAGLDPRRHRQTYQRHIGFLSAGDRGLYARLTVRRHLEYWARIAYVPPALRDGLVEEAMDAFGLREHAGMRVDRISMGWRQRTRLAMTFLPKPDLILLDEPINSLDEAGTALLYEAVEALRQDGGAAVWCSPRAAGEAIDFDAAYTLEGGRLDS